MFIANDSNYTFGQYLDRETVDIKAPVYTKCFTDTEELKGYRFVHDPEETDPEKCVSFSIYNIGSETATATPFGKYAAVSDLSSVMFRLDAYMLDGPTIRNVPFYHVIVPVENIADGTLKYLVIKMTKEVEIFPENYPYYELADTFADAQPTSADAPSGGGGGGESDFSFAVGTFNFVNNTDEEATSGLMIQGVFTDEDYGFSTGYELEPFSIAAQSSVVKTVNFPLYKSKTSFEMRDVLENLSGNITFDSENSIYDVGGNFGADIVVAR